MDIALLVKFLAPFLPFLVSVGNKAVEGASQKLGEDGWNQAKAIWAKLRPHVEAKEAAKEAAADVVANPEDEDSLGSLRKQLKKIFEADTVLAEEIAKIWQPQLGQSTGDNIQMSANAYDQSTVKQVGKIEAKEVNF
jgi:hypothetical protein